MTITYHFLPEYWLGSYESSENRELSVTVCHECGGSGSHADSDRIQCFSCGGSGYEPKRKGRIAISVSGTVPTWGTPVIKASEDWTVKGKKR